MSRNFGLKLAVCILVWGTCLSVYGTVSIVSPSGIPVFHLDSDEALNGWGTVDPDTGSVEVKIHKSADQDYYNEVHILADPTDGLGMWGNVYGPSDGDWDFADVDYTITVIATGSSSRGFHVDN